MPSAPQVVNMYMALLQERDDRLCAHAAKTPKAAKRWPCRFFNSFFINKLLDEGRGYNYVGVRRWTKKFDVFAHRMLFFPVNISNTHWCLAVVHVREKRIQYYDSMGGPGTYYLRALQRWVVDEMKHKKGEDIDPEEWRLQPTTSDTPQQKNGSDCGVFTSMCADYLSEDLQLSDFAQRDIPRLRYRIAHSIINGRLD